MGWEEGQGLGKDGTGRTEPVQASNKRNGDMRGLGYQGTPPKPTGKPASLLQPPEPRASQISVPKATIEAELRRRGADEKLAGYVTMLVKVRWLAARIAARGHSFERP